MLDLPLIHSIFTVLLFVIFIGICIWAWSKPQQKAFEEASMLPFADEEYAQPTARKKQ